MLPEPAEERLIVRKDGDGRLIDPAIADRLLQRSRQAGERQRYIVQLRADVDYDPKAMGADPELEAVIHARSERDMDALADELAGTDAGVTEVYRLLPLPLLVVEADAGGIQGLIDNDHVQVIYQDVTFKPLLNQTLPIIEATPLNSAGGTGSGQAVAVLDSGIQRNHPMLNGKIVGEACFASGFGDPNFPGCPAGHSYGSTSAGASETCTGSDDCNHGTHVSAIAVGAQQTTPQGPTIKGVVPSASLVPIRAGSLQCLGDYCLSFQATDTVAALSWVYSQRNTLNIAAANLSYGIGDAYTGYCDSNYADVAQQVDLLTGAGVAVVAATGNAGELAAYEGKMFAPSCLENTVSVAAVDKSSVFAEYSNVSPMLDLLAPGGEWSTSTYDCTGSHQCVLSAIPGSAYGYTYGTSMAAPHVAGAIAGLRNLWPKSETSVADIVQHLKDTGQSISFSQGGTNFTKPLVKLGDALASPTTPASVSVVNGYCYGLNIVSWPASSGTLSHYQVQGSHSSGFTSPFPLYQGTATSIPIDVTGTTWVRARSCNGPSCSAWQTAGSTADYYPYCL